MQDVQRQLFTDSVTAELRLDAPTDAESTARAEVLLHDLGLDTLGDRHPLSLSGGQQQRLVVATARLTRRPVVVIRDLAQDGAVVLLVSHDEQLLALAADHELSLTPTRKPGSNPMTHERART